MGNDIKTIQVKLTQKKNLLLLAAGIVLSIILIVYALSHYSFHPKGEKIEKANFSSPLSRLDTEPTVVNKIEKQLRETRKQTENLQEQMETLSNNKKSEDESTKKLNEELSKRVATLENQLSVSQNNMQANDASFSLSGSNEYQGNFLPSPGATSNRNVNHAVGQKIREDNLSLVSHEAAAESKIPRKNPDTYVPAGTFVRAVVIGGADASAAVNAQSNPQPMLLRLVANGTLPNRKKSHLKDCVVTAAAVGDISSERGQIRTESLSCVFPNGEVVDQQVEGTVFGPDGKNAVRGNYYMGGVRFLGNAFAAGALSGLSEGLSQTYTTNSISADGNVQTISPTRIFQFGAAKGTGKAMDKLADYNIKRAEQYHPVIQLTAGTIVDVVILKGFYLDGRKHEVSNNSDNYSVKNAKEMNSPTLFPEQNTESQTLPLSDESVRRIQERSKELGFRVNTLPDEQISRS